MTYEPKGSMSYMIWLDNNCSNCKHQKGFEDPEGTCEMELDYSNWAYMGLPKPDKKVLDIMFSEPNCKSLEKKDE